LVVVVLGGFLGLPLEGRAQTTDRIERLPTGETALSITDTRLPKWTGTPAVKTFQLQQSLDLRNWVPIGPAVTLEQVNDSLPLQFLLPPSDRTQFYRLKEKLIFSALSSPSSSHLFASLSGHAASTHPTPN
jgi:hypothetical protein